jgi:hypothetical protein
MLNTCVARPPAAATITMCVAANWQKYSMSCEWQIGPEAASGLIRATGQGPFEGPWWRSATTQQGREIHFEGRLGPQ